MHTYVHTYIHAYTHTYMHAYIHAYMHTCIHAYMHTCIHAYMHTCIHAYIHTSIHPYIHTSIHAYILTSIHPYILTSIHPYIHTSIHPYIHIHTYIRTYIHTYIHTHYHLVDIYIYISNNHIFCCLNHISLVTSEQSDDSNHHIAHEFLVKILWICVVSPFTGKMRLEQRPSPRNSWGWRSWRSTWHRPGAGWEETANGLSSYAGEGGVMGYFGCMMMYVCMQCRPTSIVNP